MFWSLFIFCGIQQGTWVNCVIMSWVTYLILQAHKEIGVSHSKPKKNLGEFWKEISQVTSLQTNKIIYTKDHALVHTYTFLFFPIH